MRTFSEGKGTLNKDHLTSCGERHVGQTGRQHTPNSAAPPQRLAASSLFVAFTFTSVSWRKHRSGSTQSPGMILESPQSLLLTRELVKRLRKIFKLDKYMYTLLLLQGTIISVL